MFRSFSNRWLCVHAPRCNVIGIVFANINQWHSIMFIGNVVKATEEVIYNTSTVCNSLLIINFSLYRNMVYYVHICFSNLLKKLIMSKVCPFQATDIWENSGPKEIASKAISICFYEVLIRNKPLNHQCLGQFLRCILLLVSIGACIMLPVEWSLHAPCSTSQLCSGETLVFLSMWFIYFHEIKKAMWVCGADYSTETSKQFFCGLSKYLPGEIVSVSVQIRTSLKRPMAQWALQSYFSLPYTKVSFFF